MVWDVIELITNPPTRTKHMKANDTRYDNSYDRSNNEVSEPQSPKENRVEIAQSALMELRNESCPTHRFIVDFLKGGIGDIDENRMMKEDGEIDRSFQEHLGLQYLYATITKYTEVSSTEAQSISSDTWTHYCTIHDSTRDNQERKWTNETEIYREYTLQYAIRSCDMEKFNSMIKNKGGESWRRKAHEFSELTYTAITKAFMELMPSKKSIRNTRDYCQTYGVTPYNEYNKRSSIDTIDDRDTKVDIDNIDQSLEDIYPSLTEIANRAYSIDDGYNSISTYKRAIRRYRKDGSACKARVGSTTHVYYISGYPDPQKACSIQIEGDQRNPNPIEESWIVSTIGDTDDEEHNSKNTIMTDGGIDIEDEPYIHSDTVRYWLRQYGEWGIEYYNEMIQVDGPWYWSNEFRWFSNIHKEFGEYIMKRKPCPQCSSNRGYFDSEEELRCRHCNELQKIDRKWNPILL